MEYKKLKELLATVKTLPAKLLTAGDILEIVKIDNYMDDNYMMLESEIKDGIYKLEKLLLKANDNALMELF